ncbi:TonB-dependent receptor [Acidipila rosea]|uniref:Carboxypeptidase family protein n=1 Tax=Acidipila rosea TaxID=768535 RepID=A0A4R1LB61_9BACT|nr:TonB-dependent receptor [Acidipila rosea]MBW4027511.1 TonB-dependent receptor [Acidobacteriota bacterium]TCK75414.1 carboxypeptidase family protein [Acidipila rosea]
MKRNLHLSLFVSLTSLILFAFSALTLQAQSTGTIKGLITDQSGAAVPGAEVTITNAGTNVARHVTTDGAGNYQVPSLTPGSYNVQVTAAGLQTKTMTGVVLQVDQIASENIQLGVASQSQSVQVTAAAPLIDSQSMSVGQVINPRTVQEAPLNGRHFVDLGTLIAGSVTPPQSGFLVVPIRGQGSLSFDTAGQREDTVNFMINGINLNDMSQNQITFQPEINTVQEFKVDNSSFSAEYGRNSGAIVNIATRSGTNQFHGEAYDYIRNDFFDARNFFNPQYTVNGTHVRQSSFKRNQFGGDVGGPIYRNHTFFFLSYEGLHQHQGEAVNSAVPPAGSTSTDPIIQKLLTLIPAPNAGNNFVGSAIAPVAIDQGTADIDQVLGAADHLHGYYAIQQDSRTEPLAPTVADTIPNFGDSRPARRQLLTIVETHIFGPNAVNEARLGFNRIHITFTPNFVANPVSYGIDNGVTTNIGLPQISISSLGLTFGGPAGEPQGRGDTTGVFSDTFSLLRGKHSFRFGGEYRRFLNDNFAGDTSSFSFNSLQGFLNDEVASFAVVPGTRPSRIYTNATGVYAMDSWKLRPNLTAELGFRFDWNGTPAEARNRLTVFDPSTSSLVQVGTNGLGSIYRQNFGYEPRVGLVWDPSHNGRTVVRLGYGYFLNQPTTNFIQSLALNPPFAVPVSIVPATPSAALTMANAFASSKSSKTIAPSSINPQFKNATVQSYNLNLQQQISSTIAFQLAYVGSKSTHLQLTRNQNQPINGVRPFTTVAASSPVDPGASLANITEYDSAGNANYNALWLTVTKSFSKGLQFQSSYQWTKSFDYNSLSSQGIVLQNSYDPRNNYGPSDFDVRNRWVLSGVYDLPVKGNRLIEGWEVSPIVAMQTGNPITVVTTLPTNGVLGTIRPNLLGRVPVGYSHTASGNIQYLPQAVCATATPGCLFSSPGAGNFGNEPRGAIYGPGYLDVDFSLVKNTKINNRVQLQIRTDAFNILNHVNFGQPISTLSVSSAGAVNAGQFGQITTTRFPIGDQGSSRQLQVAGKIVF